MNDQQEHRLSHEQILEKAAELLPLLDNKKWEKIIRIKGADGNPDYEAIASELVDDETTADAYITHLENGKHSGFCESNVSKVNSATFPGKYRVTIYLEDFTAYLTALPTKMVISRTLAPSEDELIIQKIPASFPKPRGNNPWLYIKENHYLSDPMPKNEINNYCRLLCSFVPSNIELAETVEIIEHEDLAKKALDLHHLAINLQAFQTYQTKVQIIKTVALFLNEVHNPNNEPSWKAFLHQKNIREGEMALGWFYYIDYLYDFDELKKKLLPVNQKAIDAGLTPEIISSFSDSLQIERHKGSHILLLKQGPLIEALYALAVNYFSNQVNIQGKEENALLKEFKLGQNLQFIPNLNLTTTNISNNNSSNVTTTTTDMSIATATSESIDETLMPDTSREDIGQKKGKKRADKSDVEIIKKMRTTDLFGSSEKTDAPETKPEI